MDSFSFARTKGDCKSLLVVLSAGQPGDHLWLNRMRVEREWLGDDRLARRTDTEMMTDAGGKAREVREDRVRQDRL